MSLSIAETYSLRSRRQSHPAILTSVQGAGRALTLLIAALPAAATVQVVVARAANTHPSDARLIREFHSHTAEFERLVDMFQEDCQLGRIAPSFVRRVNFLSGDPLPKCKRTSLSRLAEYRKLFAQLHLHGGISKDEDQGIMTIGFYRSSLGIAVNQSTKGLVYTNTPPGPVIDNLDGWRVTERGETVAYRHIEGPWYLFIAID